MEAPVKKNLKRKPNIVAQPTLVLDNPEALSLGGHSQNFKEVLETTLKAMKIDIGSSFLNPSWNLNDDFLGSYYQIPLKIPQY